MPRFFRVRETKETPYTGYFEGIPRWNIPSVHCPACGVSWGNGLGEAYPSVDLSQHPERRAFEQPPQAVVSMDEYERLCGLVRSQVPAGARLEPGVYFGPIVATATGTFGDFFFPAPWTLMVRREVLEKLRAEGVQGFNAYPAKLRFRQKNAPELLDAELPTLGAMHPSCHPASWKQPCSRCERNANPLPPELALDGAKMPTDVDVFRLREHSTVIIASERFVRAVDRLGLDEIAFKELPVR
ncbi:double-CXXCG motif protein [Myxococcaceae bacterium GXIMD 01537]